MLEFLFVLMAQAAAGAPAEGTPATAPAPIEQAAPPSVAPAEVSAQPNQQDVIRCRQVRVTGSRLPVKRCSTARLDRETTERARTLTRDMQYEGHYTPPPGSGSGSMP